MCLTSHSFQVLFSRMLLPVPVRTRMTASNPMDFSTSLLRSLRKCWPLTSTWKDKKVWGLTTRGQQFKPRVQPLFDTIFKMFVSVCAHVYLEVAVLVDWASSMWGHVAHGGDIHILVGKQEEVDTTALSHTIFSQLLIHTPLRLEQSLTTQTNKSFILGFWCLILFCAVCSWDFWMGKFHSISYSINIHLLLFCTD